MHVPLSFYDVRIPGLEMKVVFTMMGSPSNPVMVDRFRFGVSETYDVNLSKASRNKAYSIVAINKIALVALATLAPHEGMRGALPAHRPMSLLTMADMGHDMHGMDHSTHSDHDTTMNHDMVDKDATMHDMDHDMQAMDHSSHSDHDMQAMDHGSHSDHDMHGMDLILTRITICRLWITVTILTMICTAWILVLVRICDCTNWIMVTILTMICTAWITHIQIMPQLPPTQLMRLQLTLKQGYPEWLVKCPYSRWT